MPSLRVLLVEDDDSYAQLVTSQLESRSLALERVRTVADAVARIRAQPFDAILLDLTLPDSTGFRTLAAVHAVAGTAAIIVLTSNEDVDVAVRSLQAGAQDYLLKSDSDPQSLLRAIRHGWERGVYSRSQQQNEARFRALVEHSQDVITLLDEHGQVLFDSRSILRVMGYAPEERIGRRLGDFVHPEDAEAIRAGFEDVVARTDEPVTAEYRFLHKDGTWRWGEAIAVNRLEDPAVRAVVVNHRDITERKNVEQALRRSEEALRQAQKMEAVGRLAGGVAHDFNNVLTAIFGYADLLLDQFPPDDPRRRDLQEIRVSAERAAALTRQLLAFSRKQVMQPRVIVLNDVIRNVQKLVARLVGEDIRMSLDLDPGLVRVIADPGQIEQVLMNLAANARDAMPEGGEFVVATANQAVTGELRDRLGLRPGFYAKIEVRDSGDGMPGSIRDKIFEPFFTTKEQGKGTGLGLATVYGIVKQSGGYVYVDSEEGQGTTFVIYLPRAEEKAATSSL